LRVIDASDIQEPGATGTDWRLHFSIRLPEMVCDHYELTAAHGGEQLGRFRFAAGELVLADRGYSHRAGVAHVLRAGAHVVLRWNPQVFPLEAPDAKPVATLPQLRGLHTGEIGERRVWFVQDQQRYGLRLCAVRKSRSAAERARRKTRRKAQRKGTPATPESLEMASYILGLTSASAQILPARAALDLYRGRWQVELVFKRLKRLLDAGQIPKTEDTSARAWMQAKILTALLLDRVLLEGKSFPPGDTRFDTVSRRRVFLEVRDTLKAVLAPPISLPQLLERGHNIALALRVERKGRPMQMVQARKLFSKLLS
jgi:hypothetical protein